MGKELNNSEYYDGYNTMRIKPFDYLFKDRDNWDGEEAMAWANNLMLLGCACSINNLASIGLTLNEAMEENIEFINKICEEFGIHPDDVVDMILSVKYLDYRNRDILKSAYSNYDEVISKVEDFYISKEVMSILAKRNKNESSN